MDKEKNKENFYIDELEFNHAASNTEATGAVPIGSNLTADQFMNINDVVGLSAVDIKDKPIPKEVMEELDENKS